MLVGEATKRATEAAIAYASAGEHELKGKAEPVSLWRALRVTAGRGGALKSVGIEPPFVGRDRELRLVKELFHATSDERRAHLVSVIGIAGIGKSRLGWEFFKYMDGLQEGVWWHRGRCLAYGEGVVFWALAEMVRMRAGITEGEELASAASKLRASVGQFVPDDEERGFVEPRLLHLLGLEDGPTRGKEELFGAWRLFFERMADQGPVALLFEDLQWADAALVEFIAHLLEWARQQPIFVLCLARPELQRRHPEFGHGSHQTTLSLAPLSERSMRELLEGFVPGLPEDLRERILARSEGVPLYAVETVRMLLDRSLLVEQDGAYRLAGEVAELEVPETLQGLIAARLDGLAAEERRLLQDASVLGKTFTKQALAELWESQRASSIRSCPASCGRRCSASRPTHARRSAGSTGSCRTSCGVSPTRRSPGATASPGISPRRGSSRAPLGLRSRRSPRSSPLTTLRPTRPMSTQTTRARSKREHASCWPEPPSARHRSAH